MSTLQLKFLKLAAGQGITVTTYAPVRRILAQQYDELFVGIDSDVTVDPIGAPIIQAPPPLIEALIEAELVLWASEPVQVRIDAATKAINNPLLWWNNNCGRFPHLASVAKLYLAIQATSAPSERLFSHAGLTIANDRANLLPENAANLIYLHDNMIQINQYRAEHGLPRL